MAIPVKQNLKIYQGSTFQLDITYQVNGVDTAIDGYTGQMQIRSATDSTTVLYDSVTNGDITILGAVISLEISDETTAAFSFTEGVYDLEIESLDGKRFRILHGSVTVNPEVTR